MVVVVVLTTSLIQSFLDAGGASNLDEVFVGHGVLFLDHDGHFNNLAETCRVRIACLEMFRHHDGDQRSTSEDYPTIGPLYVRVERPQGAPVFMHAEMMDRNRAGGS
jgi:hypothetical protein